MKDSDGRRAWLAGAGATIETVTADSRCESFARICVVVIALREEGKRREESAGRDAIMKAVCTSLPYFVHAVRSAAQARNPSTATCGKAAIASATPRQLLLGRLQPWRGGLGGDLLKPKPGAPF